MKKIHNKLVRDKIPEIIEKSGENCEIKILDTPDYRAQLKNKLIEECFELTKASNREDILEESADLLQVIIDYCQEYTICWNELATKLNKKNGERGGFRHRIFLVSTIKKTSE